MGQAGGNIAVCPMVRDTRIRRASMDDFDDLIDELKQKRDQLRVQMNLASREVKEEWDELEEKMQEFSRRARLRETGEGVGDALGQLGSEIKQGYKRLWRAMRED